MLAKSSLEIIILLDICVTTNTLHHTTTLTVWHGTLPSASYLFEGCVLHKPVNPTSARGRGESEEVRFRVLFSKLGTVDCCGSTSY